MDFLYNTPRGSYIRLGPPPRGTQHPPDHRVLGEGEILFFEHIDGSYSFCRDIDGAPIHVVAWHPVEVVEDQGW